MIITKICGGLGNQMFQYAVGKMLALRNKTELKIDITKYKAWQFPTKRNYELDCFNIKPNFATPDEIKSLKGTAYIPKNVFTHLVNEYYPFRKKSYYKEKLMFKFDPNVLNLPDNTFLDGYWQSEKYFVEIADLIKQDFSLAVPESDYFSRMSDQILASNAVAIHIRRGDYLSNKFTYSRHGVCSDDYYIKAISIIKDRIESPYFFVFSDEHDVAKKIIKDKTSSSNYEFVSAGKGEIDMSLMKLCKHFIIANSSFSWWAAWLAENTQKNIIAPKRWLNNDTHDTSDLIPDSWLRI